MADTPTSGIDTTHPHTARVWNYYLGGKDNYPADREAAEQIRMIMPDIADNARADRGFLIRVVRYLAGEVGIRQFLDVGTGLPTANNTHEVAQATAPDSRIVYVDNDPLILAHARALLSSTPEGATDYIECDIEDPDTILREAGNTLDFNQPVAITLLGILNHVADVHEPHRIVRRLMDAAPSGSYLALTHPCTDVRGDEVRKIEEFWNHQTGGKPPLVARSREEITRFFDGLDLLEPGVVSSSQWRPAPSEVGAPAEVVEIGGLARKP